MSHPICPLTQTAVADAGSIHIVQHSPRETSRRGSHLPVVLLLHGWLGNNSDMTCLADGLAREGYRVLAPDLPFHGMSWECRPSSLRQAARFLLSALGEYLGAGSGDQLPIAVVGYSLGGRIALEIVAALSCERTPAFEMQALVLISSAPPPTNHTEFKMRMQTGINLGARMKAVSPSKEALRTWLNHSWYSSPMWNGLQDADGYEQLIESRVQGFDAFTRDLWAEAAIKMARYNWPSPFPACECPVLYLHGELDKKYSAFCTRMSSLFDKFSSVSVEGAGHNVLLQRPAIIAPLVKRFVRQEHPHSFCREAVRVDSMSTLPYSLSLEQPMKVNGKMVSHREGVLIAISSSTHGSSGVGDVCPLPGLHVESLAECTSELKDFAEMLQSQGCSLSKRCCILQQIEGLTEGMSRVCRNGVTCAILLLLSQVEKSGFGSFLGHLIALHGESLRCKETKTVSVNGVLPRTCVNELSLNSSSEPEDILVRFMQNCPFDVLKVKVGIMSNSREEGLRLHAAGREALKMNRRIRLDANKAWTEQQLRDFEGGLGDLAEEIEFIEEPCQKLDELRNVLTNSKPQSRLSIALDESLSDCDLDVVADMASSTMCRALVIKPAVIGYLSDVLKLRSVAVANNCKVVLSTVFDSGVGIAWTSLIASVCQLQDTCHGLGTFQYISQDVLSPGFKQFCVDGRMHISIAKCEEFLHKTAQRVLIEGEECILHPNLEAGS